MTSPVSRHGRHRPPGPICRCLAGRRRLRGACWPAARGRHSAAGHVFHRRSSAGRGHRPCRVRRRGDHPLRDRHEGRRGGDKEPGDGGGQGSGFPCFVQPSIVGIDAMAACGRPGLRSSRIVENGGPAVDDPAGHAVLQRYCFENSRKLAEVPAGGTGAWGFRVQPVRFPRGRGTPRRARAWRASRPASDMSGPEASSWEDLFRSYLAATPSAQMGQSLCRYPAGGKAKLRNGALLPPPGHTEGTRTWDQFPGRGASGTPRRPGPASRVTGALAARSAHRARPHRPGSSLHE